MADLIKLTCPSCGSRLDSGEKANNFICPQCGNRYLFKQEGNSISLIPILEKMQKGSTVVLGDSASVVHAENVYMGGQAGENKKAKQGIEEKVECPICGKFVDLEDTFRCKNCNRSKICLSHQDPASYFCSECVKQVQDERKTSKNRSSHKWYGIASLVFGGIYFYLIFMMGLRMSTPAFMVTLIISSAALITGIRAETRSNWKNIFGWVGIASFGTCIISLISILLS